MLQSKRTPQMSTNMVIQWVAQVLPKTRGNHQVRMFEPQTVRWRIDQPQLPWKSKRHDPVVLDCAFWGTPKTTHQSTQPCGTLHPPHHSMGWVWSARNGIEKEHLGFYMRMDETGASQPQGVPKHLSPSCHMFWLMICHSCVHHQG